ncbi:hypothetical protein P9112_006479 [Eukaryota sp. TZLM1-RC]
MLTSFLTSVKLDFRSPIDEAKIFSLTDTSIPLTQSTSLPTSSVLRNLEALDAAAPAKTFLEDAKVKPKPDSSHRTGPSAGKDWFNMTAPVMTEELDMDRELLRLRGQFDPLRRHYRVPKKKERKGEVFQVGTVISSPFENGGVSTSMAQRNKSKTNCRTVDTLIKDAELKELLDRKYEAVNVSRRSGKKPKKAFFRKKKF